jgi:hypothetical protein
MRLPPLAIYSVNSRTSRCAESLFLPPCLAISIEKVSPIPFWIESIAARATSS